MEVSKLIREHCDELTKIRDKHNASRLKAYLAQMLEPEQIDIMVKIIDKVLIDD
jgi:hypothetical protein